MNRTAFAAALLLSSTSVFAAPGQIGDRAKEPDGKMLPDSTEANVRVAGAVVEPRKAAPDVSMLKVPEGYRASIFAEGLGNARMLAVGRDGSVYVTRRTEGDVVRLSDTDRDGRADTREIVARRPGMHGLALDGDTAFLVTQRDVYSAPILPNGNFGPMVRIIDDLPDAGQHMNRTIAVRGDKLFISVGSTCNACTETSPESATMLEASKDGKSRTIYASGLRNTIGFGWHPRTGQLWGLDHGIDWLGDTQQREELNRLERGKAYGWPYIYGEGGHNPQDDPPAGLTMADWDRMSQRPAATTDAHAAPMQMAFYTGTMFPASEQGNGFAAFRGSWNRSEPVGYDIRRIRFDAAGNPVAIEPFANGLLRKTSSGWARHGRPAGLAQAADGALLFTDDENGVIYRIAYAGTGGSSIVPPVTLKPAEPLEPRPLGSALAMARPETATSARVNVTSVSFRENAAIPNAHSAYYEDLSPALGWTSVAGAQSYAILMEDPDATVGKPFVHWVVWNIAPDTTSLDIGVPTTVQIADKLKLRQGRNTRGSTGYFGPRPPVGDKPHRYHFQIFALDRMLDILPGSDRETLLAAMKGHVIGKGKIVGYYGQAKPPEK